MKKFKNITKNIEKLEGWKVGRLILPSLYPYFLIPLFSLLLSLSLSAQERIVDQIIGTVGGKIILQSDVENQYLQYLAQGNYHNDEIKCEILDQLLLQKLLIYQAQVDSVEVSESQVEGELDRRLRYFISQIGSEQKLEEYYKKSIAEIKSEFKGLIRDQMLVETMQSRITKGIAATPSDVKNFYESIPKDSLPLMNAEVEIAQIVQKPKISEEEKKSVRAKLEGYRQRVLKGESFGTLAYLYSEDKVSAKANGELGSVSRGDLDPDFAAAAFALKNTDDVSEVVETKFGMHLIQLMERRGENILVKHILLKPKVSPEDLVKCKQKLDSIATLIDLDSLTFEKAAEKFSDDTDTRKNGGKIINPQTGTSRFETDQLDPSLFFQIDKLKTGEISAPVLMQTPEGDQAYRLLTVKARTQPHVANLVDDYQRIQNLVLVKKQNEAVSEWVKKKKAKVFVDVLPEYRKQCGIIAEWFN